MITVITTASELEKIKSLIEEEVNILQVMQTGNLSSISVILDDVPFELSSEEGIQSIKRMICKNGEYEETEAGDKKKVCVIGAFGDEADIVFLAKK